MQPEIAEALNTSLANSEELKRKPLDVLLPSFSVRARQRLTQLWDRKLPFDNIFDRFAQEMNLLIGQVITAHLMTLHLPGGEVLRLGRDFEEVCDGTLSPQA